MVIQIMTTMDIQIMTHQTIIPAMIQVVDMMVEVQAMIQVEVDGVMIDLLNKIIDILHITHINIVI